jgi:hypothetical protein
LLSDKSTSVVAAEKYAKEANVYFTVKFFVNVAKQGTVQKGTPVFTFV